MICRFCGSDIPEGEKVCGACGKAVEGVETQAEKVETVQPISELPMKWFKFIIYVQLFLSALLLVFSSVVKITGVEYGGYAEYFYRYCPALQPLDIGYALIILVLAVLAIVVRQKLAHYKAGAPKLYIIYFAITGIVELAYLLVQFAVGSAAERIQMDTGLLISQIWGVVLQCGIWIPINYVYFKKRKHLFVN